MTNEITAKNCGHGQRIRCAMPTGEGVWGSDEGGNGHDGLPKTQNLQDDNSNHILGRRWTKWCYNSVHQDEMELLEQKNSLRPAFVLQMVWSRNYTIAEWDLEKHVYGSLSAIQVKSYDMTYKCKMIIISWILSDSCITVHGFTAGNNGLQDLYRTSEFARGQKPGWCSWRVHPVGCLSSSMNDGWNSAVHWVGIVDRH